MGFLNHIRRGPNKWRDMIFPVEVLDDWCKTNNLPEPEWSPDHSSVIVDGTKYTLSDFGECMVYQHSNFKFAMEDFLLV